MSSIDEHLLHCFITEICICSIGENICFIALLVMVTFASLVSICFIVYYGVVFAWDLLRECEYILLLNYIDENNICFISTLPFPQVVELLVKTGAHLTESPLRLGEVLVSAAAADNVERLKSYHIAGADLSCADPCGRTALHAVGGRPGREAGRMALASVFMSSGEGVGNAVVCWGYVCVCVNV